MEITRTLYVNARGGANEVLSTPVNYTYVYNVRHFFLAKTGTAMAVPAVPMAPALEPADD